MQLKETSSNACSVELRTQNALFNKRGQDLKHSIIAQTNRERGIAFGLIDPQFPTRPSIQQQLPRNPSPKEKKNNPFLPTRKIHIESKQRNNQQIKEVTEVREEPREGIRNKSRKK